MISLDAGNANGSLSEFDLNSASLAMTVDGVSYTFPIGSVTAFVGDNTDGSSHLLQLVLMADHLIHLMIVQT